jgi:hypothetical protein
MGKLQANNSRIRCLVLQVVLGRLKIMLYVNAVLGLQISSNLNMAVCTKYFL